MPTPKRSTRPSSKSTRPAPKSARPAAKRAGLVPPVVPFPAPPAPVMVVPAVGTGVVAGPGFGAWKLPVAVKTPGGKPAASGVVFLCGVLGADPAQSVPPGDWFTLFTLPAGMTPAQECRVLATFRQQGPAPFEPLVLGILPGGAVLARNEGFSYDSMIWVGGISFTAA